MLTVIIRCRGTRQDEQDNRVGLLTILFLPVICPVILPIARRGIISS